MKSPYHNYKILKKFIRKDRFYVQLQSPEEKTTTLPHANYQWLLSNPVFPHIPKGYVIHHLDNNAFNDDPINLVLMGKHHHMAHHLKNKNIEIPLDFEVPRENNPVIAYGVPKRKPKIRQVMRKGKPSEWRITYSVQTPTGSEQCIVYSFLGKPFKTEKDALEAAKKMWPSYTWTENDATCSPQEKNQTLGYLEALKHKTNKDLDKGLSGHLELAKHLINRTAEKQKG